MASVYYPIHPYFHDFLYFFADRGRWKGQRESQKKYIVAKRATLL